MPAPDVLPCARPAAPVGAPQIRRIPDFRAGADPASGRRAMPDAPPQPAAPTFAPRARPGAQGAFRSAPHRRVRGAAGAWPSAREAARQAAERPTGAGR